MRIGIVSLYGWLKLWDNYGTLLQNYALQSFLRKRGHETFWIRTRVSDAHSPSHSGALTNGLRGMRSVIADALRPFRGPSWNERIAAFNRDHPRYFAEFIRDYVPVTPTEMSIEELQAAPPDADCFIAGSDQVWRDVTDLNFLRFGGRNVRRVAYAVSAPWPALDEQWIDAARPRIRGFSSVSVREREGLDVLQGIGYPNPVQVADPTLLLSAEDYREIMPRESRVRSARQSFLGYFVNVRTRDNMPLGAVESLARTRNAHLRVIPLQGAELLTPPEFVITPSPREWLQEFDLADLVLTNSYHGALFAITMQKPFLVFLQSGTTEAENCRFHSALEPLGLGNRIIPAHTWSDATSSEIEGWVTAPIHWSDVDERLAELRDRSITFLETALA